MTDEREAFREAMHIMRDAFLVLEDQLDSAGWSVFEQSTRFLYGFETANKIFGDVLLQRDVETIFHSSERSVPEGREKTDE
jgi:hypothetical protein